jgi:hypothetical protein
MGIVAHEFPGLVTAAAATAATSPAAAATPATAAGLLRLDCVGGIDIAAGAGGIEPKQVVGPEFTLMLSQMIEQIPGVDAGIVAVGEEGQDGVVTDRLDMGDLDVALAGLQRFLAGAVSAHFGGRTIDAQQFEGQLEGLAVGEAHLQQVRTLVQLDFGGVRCLGVQSGHGVLSLRGMSVLNLCLSSCFQGPL